MTATAISSIEYDAHIGATHVANTTNAALSAFNTWSFKREQPSDKALLTKVIGAAVAKSAPIPFILYWGRGNRTTPGDPEASCLTYLQEMRSRIAEAYPPAACYTLIFTDTHAALNGFCAHETNEYFRGMALLARRHGFETTQLSSILRACPNVDLNTPPEAPSPQLLDSLMASAAKWYNGGAGVERGALDYFSQNLKERRAIDLTYPNCAFITFNGRKQRQLFPRDLPIFYMYSMRKGIAVKPWFADAMDGVTLTSRTVLGSSSDTAFFHP